MPSRRVSIQDIAKAAGVSHPTVSRALRGTGRVSASTRAHIIAVAAEMGYEARAGTVNAAAQPTRLIGLMVTQFADPFDIDVARGVEEVALRHDYRLIIVSASIDPEREIETARELQQRQADEPAMGHYYTSSQERN